MNYSTYSFGIVPEELFRIVTEKEEPAEKIELGERQINLYPVIAEAIWWEEINLSNAKRLYFCQTDDPARMVRIVLEIVRRSAYDLEMSLREVNFKELELFNA